MSNKFRDSIVPVHFDEVNPHEPDWEKVGESSFIPSSGPFGKKTYWIHRCCGKSMLRYKKVNEYKCKVCGKEEQRNVDNPIALCPVCKHTKEIPIGW